MSENIITLSEAKTNLISKINKILSFSNIGDVNTLEQVIDKLIEGKIFFDLGNAFKDKEAMHEELK